VSDHLWFTVLGPVRAWRDGVEVSLGAPQQRTVLAALLLREGRRASTSELCEALWGDAEPDGATSVIRTYVSRLRRMLDEPGVGADGSLIATIGGGYAFTGSADAFDLAVFQRETAAGEQARRAGEPTRAAAHLREALGLWRGEALGGIPGAFAAAERSRLELLHLGTVTARAELDLELGGHAALVPELLQLTGRRPFDERLRELLMLALYRSGNQAQALSTYRDVRILLADELGVDPGPALQALYERILRADPALLAPSPSATGGRERLSVAARRRPEGPTRLPPRLAVFCGREDELKAAHDLLADPAAQPGTVVVTGMAGVGKTTFAVQWAHQLVERFPDGRFYVDLRGFDPGGEPMTAPDTVRLVLELLGVAPGSIPANPEAATAMYRGLLAKRRIVLLLDNARDAAQARPLLPGDSGSLAIVTSRRRLVGLQALDGARAITLAVPTPAQARDLLVRRIGARRVDREPDVIEEIIDRCGRLPLALAIVAAHCAARTDFTLHAVTAALRLDAGDAGTRLDALGVGESEHHADARRVFSWSYRALTPQAARLFRLASLHPGPDLETTALASLAGLALPATKDLLAELTGAHLLTETAFGRYECHSLLRAYANELNHTLDSEAERDTARYRMLDHYVHSAAAALREYSPNTKLYDIPTARPGTYVNAPTGRGAAARWYATEHAVLMSMTHQALEQGCDEHAINLALGTFTYHLVSGHRQDSIMLGSWALQAAERYGDPIRLARSHNILASVYGNSGRTRESSHHYSAALAIAEEHNELGLQATSHLGLAIVATDEGRPQDCVTHNERAAQLARSGGHKVQLCRALANLGHNYGGSGEYDKSIELCSQALELSIELDELHAQALIHDSLGYARFHRGEHDRAFEHYRLAVDILRGLGSAEKQAYTLARIGDAHAALHDDARAEAAWSEALSILRSLGHPNAGELRAKLDRLEATA
jgi:DNA-binding SARP family transcriptional activator/tetratricopeptide (TPR) repeat protein